MSSSFPFEKAASGRAPALNSDEVESCRRGCINKAGDSLTAPIRARVLSPRWLRAAAGRWPSGRERGRDAPPGRPPARPERWCRASAPPAAAAPQRPALLTWPGRRGGRGRACSSLGSNCPCARRPWDPAARALAAKAGAGDGGRGEGARSPESALVHCEPSRREPGRTPRPALQAHPPPNLGIRWASRFPRNNYGRRGACSQHSGGWKARLLCKDRPGPCHPLDLTRGWGGGEFLPASTLLPPQAGGV